MFRAASFGGHFVLLVARHLYFLFFSLLLFYFIWQIKSVLYVIQGQLLIVTGITVLLHFYYSFLFIFNRIYCSVAYVNLINDDDDDDDMMYLTFP